MEDFKVLSDREHVLMRPQMYVGSITPEVTSDIINFKYQSRMIVPALIKIIDEIINNSIDEGIRTNFEYSNKIDVDIINKLDGAEVVVADNGRGIPVEKIGDKYRPVLAWTELRAGTSFNEGDRVTAGTHGLGSSCTNILSTHFVGITSDGSNCLTLTCTDNMNNINWSVKPSTKKGTIVRFVPDLPRFGIMEFDQDHIDVVKDRIINYAIAYPDIKFSFMGEKIHFRNIKDVAKNFHEDSISVESDNYGVVISPSGSDEEFRYISYMNGTRNKNGGSHIDFVCNKIVDDVKEHVKKKHKIDVLPNQIRQHLFIGIWGRKFNALKFDSQTKERVTNTYGEVSAYFWDANWDKIAKQILNTPSIIDPMISAILAKKEREEAALLAKKQKQSRKLRIVSHITATAKNPEDRILFIAEGDSAIGSLIETRNSSEFIGGYPLKGKILNVRGMKPVDILKNKEIVELMAIIGLEFGKPAKDLNYGKICSLTDSDQDGAHLRGLLLNFFSFWPELFDDERVCQAKTPLYICTKGKDVKFFYTKPEYDAANLKGYTVEYCKGLGTLPTEVYRECINNPQLVIFKNTDAFASIEMAFGDDANARKKWMVN